MTSRPGKGDLKEFPVNEGSVAVSVTEPETAPFAAPGKRLSDAARRALREAAARRTSDPTPPRTDEQGGPKGPEPTRFGDWERKGVAVDF